MSDLKIDVNNLIGECAVQSELFKQAGDNMASASGKAKRAKVDLELQEATLARDVRANPETYGAVKVTEAALQEIVKTDANTLAKKHAMLNAEEDAVRAKVVYEAWMQRASLLRAEVELHSFHYTSPTAKTATGQAAKDLAEKDIGSKRRGGRSRNG